MKYIQANEFVNTGLTCPECGGVVMAAYVENGVVVDCENCRNQVSVIVHFNDKTEWLPVLRAATLYLLKNYRLTISKQ